MGTTCEGVESNVWPYCPTAGASYLFAILFAASTIAHLVQAVMYKKPFCWVIIMGGLWETAAFVIRSLAVNHQSSQDLYNPQFILILVAPLWINAFDYMLLGRIIYYYLPGRKILGVNPRRLTLLFVLLDVTAFIVQIGGAVLATSGNGSQVGSTQRDGLKIYTGGVGLQQCFIFVFMSLAIDFHRKVRRERSPHRDSDWRPILYLLYTSLSLITVRIIFRIIEFAGGINSKIPTVEAYAYVFDAAPMFLALILFNFLHPGRVLTGPESEFPKKTKLTKAEKKEAKAEKKRAKEQKKTWNNILLTPTAYEPVPDVENEYSRLAGRGPEQV